MKPHPDHPSMYQRNAVWIDEGDRDPGCLASVGHLLTVVAIVLAPWVVALFGAWVLTR